jgi:odorant receptor
MAVLQKSSDFIAVPLKCFESLGFEINNKTSNPRRKKLLRAQFLVNQGLVITGLVLSLIYINKIHSDIVKLCLSVPQWGYTLMIFLKLLNIVINKKKFKQVIENLDELFPKTKEDQEAYNVRKWRKYLRGYKRIEKILVITILISAIGVILAQFLNFASTGIWNGKLVYESWYPFNEYHPVYFNIVLLWQIIEIIATMVSFLGSELIFYSFVAQISMQFNVLNVKIEGLTPKDDFKQLINQHERILNLAKLLEEIFSPTILLNFIMSSMMTCLIGYQVSSDTNIDLIIQSSQMLVICMLQFLFMCQCGTKMTVAAEQIGTSAYNFNWLNTHDRKMKIYLMMIMKRSQMPTVLTSMKFTVLDLAAFTTVRIVGDQNEILVSLIRRF